MDTNLDRFGGRIKSTVELYQEIQVDAEKEHMVYSNDQRQAKISEVLTKLFIRLLS